jgi:hypothetical protein
MEKINSFPEVSEHFMKISPKEQQELWAPLSPSDHFIAIENNTILRPQGRKVIPALPVSIIPIKDYKRRASVPRLNLPVPCRQPMTRKLSMTETTMAAPPPQTTAEKMQNIQSEAIELVSRHIGGGTGGAFARLGTIGMLVRIQDKIQRALSVAPTQISICGGGRRGSNTDAMRETLLELHYYTAMAIIMMNEAATKQPPKKQPFLDDFEPEDDRMENAQDTEEYYY